jgi:hypothetical protein
LNNFLYSSPIVSPISQKEKMKSLYILEGSCILSKYSSFNLTQGIDILIKMIQNNDDPEIKHIILDVLESSFIFSVENIFICRKKENFNLFLEFVKDTNKGTLRKKSIELIWLMIKILKENKESIEEIKENLTILMGNNLTTEFFNIEELNTKSFLNVIQKFDDRL